MVAFHASYPAWEQWGGSSSGDGLIRVLTEGKNSLFTEEKSSLNHSRNRCFEETNSAKIVF